MSTKKVIAIVVVTNLIILASLLAYLLAAGAVMAFPPGPEGLVPPEETTEGVINTKKPTIPHANYDSGWKSISKGKNLRIKHSLGGDVENYFVEMVCKDTDGDGINHNYYGIDSQIGGATYWGLTSWAINVYRDPKDQYCDKVRIRIWKTGAPVP